MVMKELSIEEKAKAYDKVIERANSLLSNNQLGNAWIYKLLPEIKESEDESIKKALIHLISEQDGFLTAINGISVKDIIAWLEKQGEPKPVPKFKIGDTMRTLQEAKDGWTDGMPFVVSIDSEYYNCNSEKIAIKDQDEYEYPPMNRKHDICDSCDEQKPVNIDYISGIREELLDIENNAENIVGLTESQWVAIRAAHRLLGEYIAKEQNPSWSEEDRDYYDAIIAKLELTRYDALLTDNQMAFLKSFKDRYFWKPTDAQIASLTIACDRNDRIGFDLTQLLRDLKKLKE